MVDQVDLARRPALERLAVMRQSLPTRIRACPQPRGSLGQPALTDEISLPDPVLGIMWKKYFCLALWQLLLCWLTSLVQARPHLCSQS